MNSMEKQLGKLSNSVAEAHLRTIETASRAMMLSAQRGDLQNTSEALSSPLIQRLRERLVELKSGAGTATAPAGLTNAVLGYLTQGIDAEAQHLVNAARNDAAIAKESEASLRSEIARIDTRLVQWHENDRHRQDLHLAVKTSYDALTGANQRYMDEAGRGDVLQPDVEVVSVAVPPDRPAFPNPLLYLAGTASLDVLLCSVLLLPAFLRRTRAH